MSLEKKEDQLTIFDPNVPLPAQPYYIIKSPELDSTTSLSYKLVDSMFKMRDKGKNSNISIIFNIMKHTYNKDVMKPRDEIRAEMLTKIYTHSRKQEDEMLRVKKYPWERSCSKQTECQGYLQYGDILVEFLEPDVIEKVKNDPNLLPKDTGMCLRCMRLTVQICVIQIKAEMCVIGRTMISTFQNIVGMYWPFGPLGPSVTNESIGKEGEYDIYECSLTNKYDFPALLFPVVGEFPMNYRRVIRDGIIYHDQSRYRFPNKDQMNPFFV